MKIAFLLIVSAIVLLPKITLAGNESGHGGDPYALEFVSRGYYVLSQLRKIDGTGKLLTGEELAQFENALRITQIELVNDELTDSNAGIVTSLVLEDPAHPGQKLIRLSRPYWKEALEKNLSVNRLVFHEYLRVIGKQDDHYEISNRLSQLEFISGDRLQMVFLRVSVKGDPTPAERPFPNVGALEAANDSYSQKYLSFFGNVEEEFIRPFSSKVNVVNSEISEEDNQKTDLLFTWPENETTSFPNDHLVGYQAGSTQKITLYIDSNKKIQRASGQTISGVTQSYWDIFNPHTSGKEAITWTPAQVVGAIKAAEDSYFESCKVWKDKMQTAWGEKLLFADCGTPYLYTQRAGFKFTDPIQANNLYYARWVRFSSSNGAIYFVR